jgi:hypothetical protein
MGTNTGVGIGIGIPFKNNALGGDRPYLPPELKARMIGVWDNYGKKNTDADRNIIKNKIPNAGGDLEILNSAYRLNSGFGGYSNDFQEYTYHENVVIKTDTNAVFNAGGQLLIPYPSLTKDVPSFKIKVSGLSNTYHFRYYYRDNNGVQHSINMAKDGNYELPICYNVQNSSDGTDCGFANNGSDIITVEILPAFEGALVTDGINDIIASIKTLEEWNIGDKGITIVSMIHQINTNTNNFITTNNIRTDNKIIGRNIVSNIEKTGIYGWYKKNIQSDTINVINNILGDKNDYTSHSSPSTNINSINNSKFYVQGYAIENGFTELSSVAHYWTFAVLGKATEDEINLIIAKYNLDRTLNPDILCNTIKQGITNENHAEFGDKLIDYSGNGRDIQLNNIAWKGDSGIGKYVEDFTTWYVVSGVLRTSSKVELIDGFKHNWVINKKSGESTINSFKVLIKGIPESGYLQYRYFESEDATKISSMDIYEDGEYSLPNSILNNLNYLVGFQLISKTPPLDSQSFIGLTITQIPSNAGALCLDGVNDFGKVTGMPVYKDYTVVTDREVFANIGAISSKNNPGAFVEIAGNSVYSFGQATSNLNFISTRSISYLSKYSYCGQSITAGAAEDGTDMWLGTIRDGDYRFFNGAIYSLMSFPYSMSKFLIERQLKKYKLGTLYPDMVEFRPVIKANDNYKIFYTALLPITGSTWEKINIGDYIPVGRRAAIQISFDNEAKKLVSAVSSQLEKIEIVKNANNVGYTILGYITSKSPQKINITIDEYIRYEDIVQPYPSLFTLIDCDTEEVYSWGSKLKVGARFKGNVVNLLPNMYEWQGDVLYNGEVLNWGINPGVVAKEMVFSWNMPFKYLIDNNEPKCILSPRLLRIPNSSYKLLGYIPDISGHGNHGVIHNSAYAEGSGVNEDGSYQFDGVDDFVTIPTTVGGKQVLMKVNWDSPNASILYDQRGYNNEFAIYNGTNDSDGNPIPAYQGRNNGQTYIDGILNSNIKASELRAITHNITITNELSSGANKTYPIIGSSKSNAYFVNMALYDFMLFDEISTDDKILELNEYVGIEAKVELPPYYWDAYGKTNLDADKATIQQRGVAVGDYDLTNYNHAYDKMSGYGGYEFVKFDNTLDWYNTEGNDSVEVVSRNGHSITLKRLTGSNFWYFQNSRFRGLISNVIPFKVNSNKNIAVIWDVHGLSISEGKDKSVRVQELVLNPNEDNYTNLKTLNEEELAQIDISTNSLYYILWFDLSTLAVNEEVTIEMLPLYPNGLVYDGVTDYSNNNNIPALTDYTYIFKRDILGFNHRSVSMHKGTSTNAGRAFTSDYDYGETNEVLAYSFGSNIATPNATSKKIIYGTKTSVDGQPITPGSNIDDAGLFIGKWYDDFFKKMVFYKLILYPKTIPLLQINFLKNLMEKDEIIDLTNPIFIKDE